MIEDPGISVQTMGLRPVAPRAPEQLVVPGYPCAGHKVSITSLVGKLPKHGPHGPDHLSCELRSNLVHRPQEFITQRNCVRIGTAASSPERHLGRWTHISLSDSTFMVGTDWPSLYGGASVSQRPLACRVEASARAAWTTRCETTVLSRYRIGVSATLDCTSTEVGRALKDRWNLESSGSLSEALRAWFLGPLRGTELV